MGGWGGVTFSLVELAVSSPDSESVVSSSVSQASISWISLWLMLELESPPDCINIEDSGY